MTIKQLSDKLHEMYSGAGRGETAAMVHLFGIKYADEIKKSGESMKAIAKAADIPESYGTEIAKGVKLAQYVTIR